jgi:threonine/homoserine/homoserine lactone efflux protein
MFSSTTSMSVLIGYGFALGWSVAWPPGPINAEIIRRCLARGFWAGYALLLGAASGDFLWAMLVAAGAGLFLSNAALKLGLGVVSTFLLLALAFIFLRGAWQGIRIWRAGEALPDSAGRFDGKRASYALGLTLALTSPWNIAFWLAVMGRPDAAGWDLWARLIVALAVTAGASTWGLVLSGATVLLRLKGTGLTWDILAKAATGLLMLYFAANSVIRLMGAVPVS